MPLYGRDGKRFPSPPDAAQPRLVGEGGSNRGAVRDGRGGLRL